MPESPASPLIAPLWDPAEHEPLAVEPGDWKSEAVAAGIDRILERTRAGYSQQAFWDPADLTLWTGAAGVLWALDRLGAGVGEAGLHAAYLETNPNAGRRGLMQGELGVLLLSWRLDPSEAKLQLLLYVIEDNLRNLSDELFEGIPGTMFAALQVNRITGSPRAAEIWKDAAALLLARFHDDPELDQPIWVQRRRGRLLRSLGAGHGFASNVASLLAGRSLLDDNTQFMFVLKASLAANAFAQRDGDLVNWPTAADPYWAEAFPSRVQWCHGAPGFITSLVAMPAPRLDPNLRGAGELIWQAGPLRKGPGLCHGTAGNALALLALHSRTGDEIWLNRARALALHALAQVEASEPHHSLWTGDIGVALVLEACLNGYRGVPILDFL